MFAYLDNSATTRPNEACVEAMTTMLREQWGNPSSVHDMGIRAMQQVAEARKQVAKAMGAQPERVFFTSCGTEADSWAIYGTARRLGKRGKHIVTTQVEHHAVLHPMEDLESQGFEVTYLQPDKDGRISVEALENALRPDTILVSVMMVCNETGAVMPIRDMVRITRRKSPLALFHTDAVQGLGKVPFQAKTLGADLISVSGHKLHGPKGVGALYMKPGVNLPPFLRGGGQESGQRSGTEATPAIVGFGAACAAQDFPKDIAHMTALRDKCRELLGNMDGVELLGAGDAPHIITASVPGLRSQGILNCLQEKGVYVSAGSACSRGHRSHVLEAMGLSAAVMDGAFRISLCGESTEEMLLALAEGLETAKKVLKG